MVMNVEVKRISGFKDKENDIIFRYPKIHKTVTINIETGETSNPKVILSITDIRDIFNFENYIGHPLIIDHNNDGAIIYVYDDKVERT